MSFRKCRDHTGYGLGQWETVLYTNASCHWLSLHPEWSPICFIVSIANPCRTHFFSEKRRKTDVSSQHWCRASVLMCWCVYMSSVWTNIMSTYAVLTAPNHQQTQYGLEASVTVFPSYINSCMQFCWASGVFQNDKWKPGASAAHRRLIGYKHCLSIILKEYDAPLILFVHHIPSRIYV